MPIVKIDVQSGKTTSYKRAILHGVRDALVEALGVAPERVMQRIVETPAEDIDAADARTDRLTIIEISMLPGRGPDLKREAYQHIVRRLGLSPGIDVADIVIMISDPAAECFYLNGRMMCDPESPVAEHSGGES